MNRQRLEIIRLQNRNKCLYPPLNGMSEEEYWKKEGYGDSNIPTPTNHPHLLPITLAVLRGDEEYVRNNMKIEYILPNSLLDGNTVLHLSSLYEPYLPILKIVSKFFPESNVLDFRNKYGDTALSVCIRSGNMNGAHFLLSLGYQLGYIPRMVTLLLDLDPQWFRRVYIKLDNKEVLSKLIIKNKLLNYKAIRDICPENENNFIRLAIMHNRLGFLSLFIRKEGGTFIQDDEDLTPLHHAIELKNIEAFKMIITVCPDLNKLFKMKTKYGEGIMDFAIHYKQEEMINICNKYLS